MNAEWADVPCPLPGCNGPLHLQRTTDRGLCAGDFADGMALDPEDAHASTWQVQCEEGHVVLVPGPTGCPHGDDDGEHPCPHEGAFDGSDDYRAFHGHDLGRLKNLLDLLAATP